MKPNRLAHKIQDTPQGLGRYFNFYNTHRPHQSVDEQHRIGFTSTIHRRKASRHDYRKDSLIQPEYRPIK